MSDSQTKSSSSKGMKVTDRRMFTAEGELRDEYRHLGEESSDTPASQSGSESPATADATTQRPPEPQPPEPQPPEPQPENLKPAEAQEPAADQASFYDLVSLLAEHASIYLRQGSMPGPEAAESLQLCKLHIDLLAVLKDKTSGNLDAQEQAMLEDMLYRLRLAFTSQRRGF